MTHEDESMKLRNLFLSSLSKASSLKGIQAQMAHITRHFDLGNLREADYTYLLGVAKGMTIKETSND